MEGLNPSFQCFARLRTKRYVRSSRAERGAESCSSFRERIRRVKVRKGAEEWVNIFKYIIFFAKCFAYFSRRGKVIKLCMCTTLRTAASQHGLRSIVLSDVDSSYPPGVGAWKGSAVRRLKGYASWV
jgi:hypothetical protein